MNDRAKLGDRVRVQYSVSPEDAPAAARKRRRSQSLEFTVGSGEAIPGLSVGVVGMAAGEQKRLTLRPQDAYGEVLREPIKEVSRKKFPAGLKLFVGKKLTAVGVNSRRRRQVQVVEIGPNTVVIDGNHPLAGKTVEVEVELLSLQPAAAKSKAPRNGKRKADKSVRTAGYGNSSLLR